MVGLSRLIRDFVWMHFLTRTYASAFYLLLHQGSVKVWDTRVEDPVADMSPDDSSQARDCWAVAFGVL